MTESHTGKDRLYAGEKVNITYNLKRCIHAEFCVNHLATVFDKQARPWINANAAPEESVATVVEMCPSGALHYDRKDGLQEAIPEKNTLIIRHNGPLEIRGDLSINGSNVMISQETRATICRCGSSNNKPFCDNSHKDSFEAVEVASIDQSAPPASGKLTITPLPNGPLDLQGGVTILNEAGEILFTGDSTRLCRCGGSTTKPFCDGTHNRIAFVAE
jgi:CDGSH-type Zn-finger protein/uncharacterized Fe-S cluster protein YjdI